MPKKVKKEDPNLPLDMTRLLLKVGRIKFMQVHPEAEDHIYYPIVDTGGADARMIATGLVKHYKPEELDERLCVVMINIRRLSIYGLKSQGIILCAQKKNKVEPLLPPSGSNPGDLVIVQGYEIYREDPTRVTYEEFNMIAKDLRVNGEKRAVYRDIPLEVDQGKGYITTEILDNCPILSPIKD